MYSLFINVLHAKGRFSKEYFYNLKKSVMKVEKFKVLLYLKKSEPDKTGKAPIMGRITLNRTMAQFSCKLSCTPGLWNARESRLNGKSREAVETNEKNREATACRTLGLQFPHGKEKGFRCRRGQGHVPG